MRIISFVHDAERSIAWHRAAYENYVKELLDFLSTAGVQALENLLKSVDLSNLESTRLAGALASSQGRGYVEFVKHQNDRLAPCGGLITADAQELSTIVAEDIRTYKLGRWASTDVKGARKALKALFAYERFRNGETLTLFNGRVQPAGNNPQGWSGLKFLQELDVHVCPYCNADTVYAVEIKRKRTGLLLKTIKSALDHFYCRKNFPYLGLSLFNLVPSCSRCNTSLKGSKTMRPGQVLNPYLDSADDYLKFQLCEGNIGTITEQDKQGAFKLMLVPKDDVDKQKIKCARYYLEDVFKTEEVYNTVFFRESASVIYRARQISSSMRKFFADKLDGLSPEHLIFGSWLESKDINRRSHAKLTKDLVSCVQEYMRKGER